MELERASLNFSYYDSVLCAKKYRRVGQQSANNKRALGKLLQCQKEITPQLWSNSFGGHNIASKLVSLAISLVHTNTLLHEK